MHGQGCLNQAGSMAGKHWLSQRPCNAPRSHVCNCACWYGLFPASLTSQGLLHMMVMEEIT